MSESAKEYHDYTSYSRFRMGGRGLEWFSRPEIFKSYPGYKKIPLPKIAHWPQETHFDLFAGILSPNQETLIDLSLLSQIMGLAHMITATARYSGTDFYYRSAASAGALYPFEIYVGALGICGLNKGIYHHDVAAQELTLLKDGDISNELARGIDLGERLPAAAFFFTAIFHRSAWKYQDRGYRYNLLDTGHLIENLIQGLRVLRVPYKVYFDFIDERINDLLGVNDSQEVCLAIILAYGRIPDLSGEHKSNELERQKVSLNEAKSREPFYPVIRAAHQAGYRIPSRTQYVSAMCNNLGLDLREPFKINPPAIWPNIMGYTEAVFRRRSMRNFIRRELSQDQFAAIITGLCNEAGSHEYPLHGLICIGLLASRIEGVDAGFYVLDAGRGNIVRIFPSDMADEVAHICLGQGWLANSAVHFLFIANLDILDRLSPRAYRYAMLTAGQLGQRIYVIATSMKIGCCGIGAFYDDDAAKLLGLKGGSRLLYLVTAGPVKKWAVI